MNRITKLFMLLLLLLQMLPNNITQAATTNNNVKLDVIGLDKNSDGTVRTTYLSSAISNHQVNIDVSGSEIITKSYVDIVVPKTYISNVAVSTAASVLSIEDRSTATEFIKRVYLRDLPGGTSIGLPIQLTGKTGMIPENEKIPLTATFYDNDGSTLATDTDYRINMNNPGAGTIYANGTSIDNQRFYGGTPDNSNSMVISQDGAVPINFSFNVYGYNDSRTIDTAATSVTVNLPANAYFDAALNPTWTYNPINNTVTYKNVQYDNADLKLSFPGQVTETPITLNATWDVKYVNQSPTEANGVIKDDITFILYTELMKMGNFNKWPDMNATSDYGAIINTTSELNKEIKFAIGYVTPAGTVSDKIKIEDYDLDSRFEYTAIELYNSIAFVDSLVVTLADGTKQTIAVSPDTSKYNLPQNTINIAVNYKGVPGSTNIFSNVYAKAKQDTTFSMGEKIYNTAKVTAFRNDDSAIGEITDKGNYIITDYAPKMYIFSNQEKNIIKNQTVTFENYYNILNTIPSHTFEYINGYLLVPDGLTISNIRTSTSSFGTYTQVQPEIIKNYNGTGMTLYKYPMPNTQNYGSYTGYTKYDVTANDNIKVGKSTIQQYYVASSNTSDDQKLILSNPITDTYDVNQNGSITDKILKVNNTVNYIPPTEVYTTKLVKGATDSAYSSYSNLEAGEKFTYQLKMVNNTVKDASNVVLIDKFPVSGDSTLVENSAGSFTDRGSSFRPTLTGPVTAPTGTIVYYTTDTFPNNTSASILQDSLNWQTSVSDYSAVTGIKIMTAQNVVLPSNQTFTFTVPMQMPDETLELGDKAVNSTAISQNGGSFNEAYPATVAPLVYKLEGTLFGDNNLDSIYQKGETTYSGVKVELLDANRNPILDQDGSPITTVTDANGHYSFDVTSNKSYSVKFNYDQSQYKNTKPITLAQHSQASTMDTEGYTAVVTVDRYHSNPILNGGLIQDGSLTIKKTDKIGRVLSDAEFKLVKDGHDVYSNLKTNAEGIIKLTNVTYGDYQLIETKAPIGFTIDETPKNISITSVNKDVTITVENEANAASLYIWKTNENEDKDLPGAEFSLYNGDTLIADNLVTDEYGRISIDNLDKDIEYTLVETKAPEGYYTDSKEIKFSIQDLIDKNQGGFDSGAPYAYLSVINKVDLNHNLTINKVSSKDLKVLSGAQFEITKVTPDNRVSIGIFTTDTAGQINTALHEAGSYEIKEVKAPASYEIDDTIHTAILSSDNTLTIDGILQDKITIENNETQTPKIDLEKSVQLQSGSTVAKVGDVATYTLTVTNTGNTELTDVKVTDPMFGAQIIHLANTTLQPGESTTGTAQYTVQESDLVNGIVKNTATATGTPPGDLTPPEDTDIVTFEVESKTEISLEKTTTATGLKAGEKVDYTFTVTNTGSVTLTDVKVDDPMFEEVILATTVLKPGESTTGKASHIVTQEEVNKGELVNTATTTGTPPGNLTPPQDTDTVTITETGVASIDLDKASDVQTISEDGTINYTFKVTNTGNVTLKNVIVTDPMFKDGITLEKTILEPNESTTGTASIKVSDAPIIEKKITNTATATGTPPVGSDVTDEDTVIIDLLTVPSIMLEKTADKAITKVGDEVTYTLKVTNNGNETLKDVKVNDPMYGVEGLTLETTTLKPGESTSVTFKHVVTEADISNQYVNNTAKATGVGIQSEINVSSEDTVKIPVEHVVIPTTEETTTEVTTTENPTTEETTSENPTTEVTTTENPTTEETTSENPTTEVTTTENLTTEETTSENPTTEVTTTENPTTEETTSENPTTEVTTSENPTTEVTTTENPTTETTTTEEPLSVKISLDKSADKETYTKIGEKVTYKFEVKNTGTAKLTDVKVTDPMFNAEIQLEKTTLNPGEKTIGYATYTVESKDVNKKYIFNKAEATGIPPANYTPPKATDEVIITYKSDIVIIPPVATTELPTTEGNTGKETTTEQPTLQLPTTELPTVQLPTTEGPTTKPGTTIETPTTEVATTEKPSTETPTTEVATTEKPSSETPTTEIATTEKPSTETPTIEIPVTEKPSIEVPSIEQSTVIDKTIENPNGGVNITPAENTTSEDVVTSDTNKPNLPLTGEQAANLGGIILLMLIAGSSMIYAGRGKNNH